MQATVRSFDAATRSGTVLLDDGTELPYDADAFDAGQVRLLRIGQRVRIEIDGYDSPISAGGSGESAGGADAAGAGRDATTRGSDLAPDARITYLTILTLPDRR